MSTFRPVSPAQKALVALCLLSTVGLFCSRMALAEVAPDAAGVPLEIGSYQEHYDVSEGTAEENLTIQHEGSEVVPQLEAAQGPDYAGVWFDNQSGEFVVPLLDPANRNSVGDTLREADLQGDYRTKTVQTSWLELEEGQQEVDASLSGLLRRQLATTFIDPRSNAVVIQLADGASAADRDKAVGLAADAKVEVEVREAEVDRFDARTESCSFPNCQKPLRGGVEIRAAGSCSAGFAAVGNTYGNHFLITAGHCVYYAGGGWTAYNPETGGGITIHTPKGLGAVESWSFPGGDWAKIKAGSWWDTESWPSKVAFWGTDQEYPINYESGSYVGQWVCHAGRSTGASCGTVLTVEQTTNFKGGTVYGTTTAGPMCNYDGDSGGPVFANNTALGIFSGAYAAPPVAACNTSTLGPGEEAGYGTVIYAEITAANQAMGTHIGTAIGAPPGATTGAASNEQGYQATVAGTIDPNGLPTSYHVEYGTTSSYGSSTPSFGAGSGWSAVGVSTTLTNLQPATSYHFRIVANNSAGTSYGSDRVFGTLAVAPVVKAQHAVVTRRMAILDATIFPGGTSASYHFEYGPSASYGARVPLADQNVGGAHDDVFVSESITNLEDGVYHYRVVASNFIGVGYGQDQQFVVDNRPLVTLKSPTTVKSGSATLNAAVNPQEFATQYQFEYATSSTYESTGGYESKAPATPAGIGAGIEDVPVSAALNDLEPETVYHYRLVASNVKGTRVSEDKTLRTATVPPSFSFSFGTEGEGDLAAPRGLAMDSAGNLWVADSYGNRIVKFNPKGEYLSAFGSSGEATGKLNSPNGIAIDSSGNLWVAEGKNRRLQKFNPKGEYLAQIKPAVFSPGEFGLPWGVAIDPSGNLWVTDKNDNSVKEFTAGGEFIRSVHGAGSGSANGEFHSPTGIAIDKAGNVWVVDSLNYRVQKLSSSGAYLSQFKATPYFETPLSIAIKPSGDLLIGEPAAEVRQYTSSGEYVTNFHGAGNQLKDPEGIAVGAGGAVYVSNGGWGWVEKWQHPYPVATTLAADGLARHTATLRGSVNPHGVSTSYYFEYGPTTAYGSRVPASPGSVGSGTSEVAESASVTGLSADTTYHSRLVATSSNGASYGKGSSFKTASSWSGSATTEMALGVKAKEATLRGTVNPGGSATGYWFEYGKTTSYGTKIPVTPKAIGSGTTGVPVSQTPTGLGPKTTYHFRVAAESEGDIVYGADKALTTLEAPKATTESATAVKAGEATLRGTVNPEGASTSYWFEYGKTTSYGTKIPVTPKAIGSGTTGVAVSQTPTGLLQETIYHFRVVGQSADGVTYGSDRQLKTLKGNTWLHNELALRDEAKVNFAGSITFENEVGEIECQISSGLELDPGSAPATASMVVGNGGKDCKSTGFLAEGFKCQPTSVATGGPVTVTPSGAKLKLSGVKFTYTMGSSCLLGTEIYVECSKIMATPDQMATIGEIDLADTSSSCESNIGPEMTSGELTKESPVSFSGSLAFENEYGGFKCNVLAGIDLGPSNSGTIPSLNMASGGKQCETVGPLKEEFHCQVQSTTSKALPAVAGKGAVLRISNLKLAFNMTAECLLGSELTLSCEGIDAMPDDVSLIGELSFVNKSQTCGSNLEALSPSGSMKGLPLGDFGFGLMAPNWIVEFPSAGSEVKWGRLSDVACRALKDCLAVGTYEPKSGPVTPLAESWNGSAWTPQALPMPTGVDWGGASRASCPSPTTCIVVGYGTDEPSGVVVPTVARWNGTKWVAEKTPVPGSPIYAALSDVSCVTANWCVAVGDYHAKAPMTSETRPYAVRWNGTSWSLQTTPLPSGMTTAMLSSVDCTADFKCVAVGYSYANKSIVESWNGSSWSASSLGSGDLFGVSCLTSTSCIATGNPSWKLAGAKWTQIEGPYLSELEGTPKDPEKEELEGPEKPITVGDVSCVSAEECVADAGPAELVRWDGAEWRRETAPGAAHHLDGLTCLAPVACIGVGWTGEPQQPAAVRLNFPG